MGAMPPGARGGGVFPARSETLDNYKTDPTELTREANELATLATQLRDQIKATNNGTLLKDLAPNLKRIEKLAKHLRSEIILRQIFFSVQFSIDDLERHPFLRLRATFIYRRWLILPDGSIKLNVQLLR